MSRLANRHAVVTGAGRGLGRAITEAFAAEGARVLALSRTKRELDELEKRFPGSVVGEVFDVTDRAQVDALPALALRALGRVDILVNNAGVWMERDFLSYTRLDWDLTLATNLTAVFDVTQALLPTLLESGSARIVNIASIDGQVGFQKLVAQCASKFGLIGFTKALAKELWTAPITVNAICPAEIDKSVPYAETPTRVPAPERALAWDVARAALYLASEEGVRVTGTCLDVHGLGFLAS
jgi:NAD(P)-dependent dehydrogenase (short-subunit alcohol dehydrogenase family)